jgi:probable HAF family extracellular repeat protein
MQDLGTLPGGYSSDGLGINASGQVVGWSSLFNGTNHCFLWTSAGGMQDIGDLPGGQDHCIGFGINDSGHIVGYSGAAMATRTPYSPFLWTSGGGMQDLSSSLDASGAGWELTAATAINNPGQIVGYGFNPSGAEHAFLLTPVPDPPVLGFTQFNDPPLGAGTFRPGAADDEMGFTTATTPTSGVSPLAAIAVGPEGTDPRVLTHRSINATTTFDAVDLANFDDAFMSLRMRVADTTYEAGDRVRIYVTNDIDTIDLVNLSGATGLNDLAGDGFLRFWAAIPNDWTQVALLITSSSNSTQASERFDFDTIEFRGVVAIPEPATLGVAVFALLVGVAMRLRRPRGACRGRFEPYRLLRDPGSQ